MTKESFPWRVRVQDQQRGGNNMTQDKNSHGETFEQFVAHYDGLSKAILSLCWRLGLYPEELAEDIKALLKLRL